MITPERHVFFVGPRKTGTTTIYDVLRAQGVRTPLAIKETFFFEQPEIDLSDYATKYGLDPALPFVEVSPSYFTSDQARRNLLKHFPDAHIVITLRSPVRRALSALSHGERIGLLDVEKERANGTFDTNKHVQTILRTSDFEPHITAWAEAFPGRTIVMRQNVKGALDAGAIEQTARACGLSLPAEELVATRSNQARQSRSPTLTKRAKAVMRGLDQMGLGWTRRVLKPLGAILQRPAPTADSDLVAALEERLEESILYYESQPNWRIR